MDGPCRQQRGPHAAVSCDRPRRLTGRAHEGKDMKNTDRMLYRFGRFVFGLGLGVALTSTYVIVTGAPDLLAPLPAVEVVRLDRRGVGTREGHVSRLRSRTATRRLTHRATEARPSGRRPRGRRFRSCDARAIRRSSRRRCRSPVHRRGRSRVAAGTR